MLDVIDTRSLERVKSIPDTGPLHDISLTPDGKYVVAGSEEIRQLTVVDVQTEQVVWSIKFDNIVRTMAFERNSDGSTRRIFLNTSYLHGFEVVDFAERKVAATIKLPDESGGQSPPRGVFSHGMGVTPDNKTLWVNSTLADAVFAYSLPDPFKLFRGMSVPEYTRSGSRVLSPTARRSKDDSVTARTIRCPSST